VKVDAGKLIGASKSVISALADSGITIIAARVESERLAAEMIELGVVCGQGFVFGHPKPARQGGGTKQRLAA
jgi:EAL domain-containing protein (putative c-di-GMP-specific phosphodiesterase class I)